MTKVIRVDQDVKSSLDGIRNTYGDRNYSDAIRRALFWRRVADGSTSTPKGTIGGGPK